MSIDNLYPSFIFKYLIFGNKNPYKLLCYLVINYLGE